MDSTVARGCWHEQAELVLLAVPGAGATLQERRCVSLHQAAGPAWMRTRARRRRAQTAKRGTGARRRRARRPGAHPGAAARAGGRAPGDVGPGPVRQAALHGHAPGTPASGGRAAPGCALPRRRAEPRWQGVRVSGGPRARGRARPGGRRLLLAPPGRRAVRCGGPHVCPPARGAPEALSAVAARRVPGSLGCRAAPGPAALACWLSCAPGARLPQGSAWPARCRSRYGLGQGRGQP